MLHHAGSLILEMAKTRCNDPLKAEPSGPRQGSMAEGVSMTAENGQCTALLGRNGMGKTTLAETIMGLLRPRQGQVSLDGHELVGREPFQIAQLGLALVPRARHVFPSLNVEENLTLAARGGDGDSAWTLERVYHLFPQLKERRRNRGNDLSGGEQQMLVIARALMTNPRLLVMDEPSEGLAPVIVDRVGEVIAQLRDQGLCLFLVEQNYRLAMDVANKVYVLSKGQIVWDGVPAGLAESAEVRELHLGV